MARHGRKPTVAVAVALTTAFCVQTAQADIGRALIRGVTWAMTPNIGATQNGPNRNDNFFSQRYTNDPRTGTIAYENSRLFGQDTFGNRDTLNLGLLNLQLGPVDGSGLNGAGVYTRYGANRYIIPEVFWDSRTTARDFSTFGGAQGVQAPVQYNGTIFLGVNQYNVNGQIQYNSSGSVDLMGNYRVQFAAINSGTMQGSGLVDNRAQDISFDLGPVNLSGNYYVDIALAAFNGIAEQLGLPTDTFPSPTAKPKNFEELARKIANGQPLSAAELMTYVQGLIENKAANPEEAAAAGSPTPDPVTPGTTGGSVAPVPEPATAVILLFGAVTLLARRSKVRPV